MRGRLHRHSQAWSRIVHKLIPNAPILAQHLAIFSEACGATEVVLFERTTFLVIATSSPAEQTSSDLSAEGVDDGQPAMEPTRYERTSELVKGFRHSCSRLREEFHSLEMELPGFTAVLDELTRNTYIMVVVHDPAIGRCPWSMTFILN
jgi:Ras-related GTP-binding protein A/B